MKAKDIRYLGGALLLLASMFLIIGGVCYAYSETIDFIVYKLTIYPYRGYAGALLLIALVTGFAGLIGITWKEEAPA